MKNQSRLVVFASLILLLSTFVSTGVCFPTANASAGALSIIPQVQTIGNGQVSFTNQTTLGSPYDVELVIPKGAEQGSGCMALYPYYKTLNTLQSLQVYASYTNATPRFAILLDTNGDGSADLLLLSDYQFTSDGAWQLIQGGQRWGWTTATLNMSEYGTSWQTLSYWKTIYGNATVVSVGVALEYWAVHDNNGLGEPLYVDELVLNGQTYAVNQAPIPTDNWSMFRHDLQRTGVSTSPATDNNLLWKYFTAPASNAPLDLQYGLRASPAVVNGVVYMGSNDSEFLAINATDGSKIWEVNVGGNVESSAAVTNGIVYFGVLWNGQNGYVDALNASTGSVVWRYAANSGIESSPAVVNGVVYIGSFYGYVYALNATNGALLWSYLTGGSTFSSPAVGNGAVYIGSIDGKIYALNLTDGSPIWAFQTGIQIYSSPVVADSNVYFITDSGVVYKLRSNDGAEIWQANIGFGDHSDDSPSVANGVVYVGDRNGYYALNATTGSQIWFFTSPYSPRQFTGYVYSSPAVAGNVVYFGSSDGYVFALCASNGGIVWSYRTGGFLFSSPAIINGVVYIGSYDGNIYAVGTPLACSSALTQPTETPSATSTPAANLDPPVNSTLTAQTCVADTVNPAPDPAVSTGQAPLPVSSSPPLPAAAPQVTQPPINWYMLAAVTIMLLAALVTLMLIFLKKPPD